jgi:hypothetical protein
LGWTRETGYQSGYHPQNPKEYDMKQANGIQEVAGSNPADSTSQNQLQRAFDEADKPAYVNEVIPSPKGWDKV